MATRKRRGGTFTAGELNLTAMIDVAFQLLSFFIISSRPQDVLTNLDVSRPAPDAQTKADQDQPMIRVSVFTDGYQINDKNVTWGTLAGLMAKLAEMSKTQTIVISSVADAPHESLIRVIDLCAQVGLKNVSVMSL